MILKTITPLIIIFNQGYAKIDKTISSASKQSNYITFKISPDERITLYKNFSNYSLEYENKDLYFFFDGVENKNSFIKVKNRSSLYTIDWPSKNSKDHIVVRKEENPKYFYISMSNECPSYHKSFLDDFDLIGKIEPVSDSKVKFSTECEPFLKKYFTADYGNQISQSLFSLPRWNNQSLLENILKKISNKSILDKSQKGLDGIKDGSVSISKIKCDPIQDCNAGGSYSPIDNQIVIYPSCLETGRKPECNVLHAILEETLHQITMIGNEQPAHNDLKAIVAEIGPCSNSSSVYVATKEYLERGKYNEEKAITLTSSEVSKDVKPPENLAQPFNENPPTDRPRTVAASAADLSFTSGIGQTVRAVREFSNLAIEKAESHWSSSAEPRHPANSSAQTKSSSLNDPKQVSSIKSSEPTKSQLPEPNADPKELALAAKIAGPAQPAKTPGQNSSGELGKSATNSDGSPANFVTRSRSTSSTTSSSSGQQRTTASIPPTAPLDSSTLGALPTDVKEAMKDTKITLPTLKSQIQNPDVRQKLSENLSRRKISIVGLSDQPLGLPNLKEAKSVYKYSEQEGAMPRLKKVQLRK